MQYVLTSTNVFTATTDQPFPAALLIENNRIKKVAQSISQLEPFIQSDAEIHDFGDQLIMPGFHDFHLHLFPGALQLQSVDLSNTSSAQQVIEAILQQKELYANKQWIIGFGWDNGGWEDDALPTKELLDTYFPDTPVILNHLECHYCWVNSKALQLAGITTLTPNPQFGEIVKNEAGEVTGILMEKAQSLVQALAYNFSSEEKIAMLTQFFEFTARHGITSFNDMYAPFAEFLDDFDLLFELEAQQLLKARVHLQPKMDGDLKEARHFKEKYTHSKIQMNGLKQFIDGVITGHTAYMNTNYADAPHRGTTTFALDDLEQWIIEADREGFSVRLHAIGDGAVTFALNTFEKARKVNGPTNNRHTIEHIESIRDEDIPRFAKLDVIASIQPYHLAALEQSIYVQRLGNERFQNTYLSKSFLQTGATLAFGSDFPVVHLDPMREIFHAVTRKDNTLTAEWNGAEKVTMSQALKAYTAAPAFGCFREHEMGTLEEGKLADIIVLNNNLFDSTPEQILQTDVVWTMVDGDIVFQKYNACV